MSSSNTKPRTSQASEIAKAQQLIVGLGKHLANASFTVASTSYTSAEVTSALEQLVTVLLGLAAARARVRVKLVALESQHPALLKVVRALVKYVKLTYGDSPEILADFGITPDKVPTPLTVEQKVVAVFKRASTRKARGTTSKKARMAIHGTVVDVALTPVVAPVTREP
jgi:hypothetical protein